MRKISVWAKNHKWAARFLIITCYLLLNFLGVVIGFLLNDISVHISSGVFVFFIILFLGGIFFYPSKKDRSVYKNYYVLQKSFDFTLALSTLMMVIYIGNHHEPPFSYFTSLRAANISTTSLPGDSSLKTYKSIEAFKASMKDEDGKLLKWKERKKLLKEQIKGIKKSKTTSDGGKIALIILSSLVAMGLLVLVASAACSLSCNGSDGAAILVGVGGTVAIVLLFLLVLRSINRKPKKENLPEETPKPDSKGV